ncbi:hypothetical protein JOB18_049179 [Solea senegalensis]|uniref:Uncharacterized protein n=1 Tax=Solea senegalensis TaxID=28829 RepID=A0AAV6QFM8_SOLSE|nr:hypothetical protein JOB18_049179 [Solea senegalensis]
MRNVHICMRHNHKVRSKSCCDSALENECCECRVPTKDIFLVISRASVTVNQEENSNSQELQLLLKFVDGTAIHKLRTDLHHRLMDQSQRMRSMKQTLRDH